MMVAILSMDISNSTSSTVVSNNYWKVMLAHLARSSFTMTLINRMFSALSREKLGRQDHLFTSYKFQLLLKVPKNSRKALKLYMIAQLQETSPFLWLWLRGMVSSISSPNLASFTFMKCQPSNKYTKSGFPTKQYSLLQKIKPLTAFSLWARMVPSMVDWLISKDSFLIWWTIANIFPTFNN